MSRTARAKLSSYPEEVREQFVSGGEVQALRALVEAIGHVADALELLLRRLVGHVRLGRARTVVVGLDLDLARDIAVEAPDALLVGELRAAIETSAGDLCESVELFDVFRPEASERRSLAFRLVYRDPKASTDPERARTLTDKEVDARQAKVVARVTEMGAVLRA